MYRKWPYKLILQSNHKRSKLEPIALFNLRDNVAEKPTKNLVKSPEQHSRVKQMQREYAEMFQTRKRTTPE